MVSDQSVVGIDVGGERKGFHAVALRDGRFVDKKQAIKAADIVQWCRQHNAVAVAVDAPCGWSQAGSSRLCERKLEIGGKRINCFATPTREGARTNEKGFYDWVFNGEQLYQLLLPHYALYDGTLPSALAVFETFPQAVVCALAGWLVAAKTQENNPPSGPVRAGYDDADLPNIDFVDVALCAVAADFFLQGRYTKFGGTNEGLIVLPKTPSGLPPPPVTILLR